MIDNFSGEHDFLSNFYHVYVVMDGLAYPSVEHAYQAAKTLDPMLRVAFTTLRTPAAAKKAGRQLKVRPDWESVKVKIMEELVRQKFSCDPLRQQLLDTGDELLVEGNWWNDTFWGVCRGVGLNHLGIILMKVRSELKGEKA